MAVSRDYIYSNAEGFKKMPLLLENYPYISRVFQSYLPFMVCGFELRCKTVRTTSTSSGGVSKCKMQDFTNVLPECPTITMSIEVCFSDLSSWCRTATKKLNLPKIVMEFVWLPQKRPGLAYIGVSHKRSIKLVPSIYCIFTENGRTFRKSESETLKRSEYDALKHKQLAIWLILRHLATTLLGQH